MKKNALYYFVIAAMIITATMMKSCAIDTLDAVDINSGNQQKILDGYAIQAIAFDSKGNAWIGAFIIENTTDEKPLHCIIRYNGQETEIFNSTNSIIPKDFYFSISDIAVDKNDNVWIGGSGGLLKYDGKKFILYNSKNTAMPEDIARSIAVDSKNNIWFASCRFKLGGLVKYDGKKWTSYTPDNSALPDNLINDIAIDQSDNVWLTVNDYLVKKSDDKWKVYDKDDLGLTNFIFAGIQFNSKNSLLGITDHSFNGSLVQPPCELYSFDGKKAKILTNIDNLTSIPGNTKITLDSNDNIWCYGGVGRSGGVWYGNQWMQLDNSGSGVSGLWIIKEDREHRIWIGTENGILIRMVKDHLN